MPSWVESVPFLPWVSKAQNSRTLSQGPEEYLKVIELVPNNRRYTTSPRHLLTDSLGLFANSLINNRGVHDGKRGKYICMAP